MNSNWLSTHTPTGAAAGNHATRLPVNGFCADVNVRGVIELPEHLCPLSAQHTATLPCNLMWSHTDTHKGTYFCTKNSISSLKQLILSQMFVKTAVRVGA